MSSAAGILPTRTLQCMDCLSICNVAIETSQAQGLHLHILTRAWLRINIRFCLYMQTEIK